jgi:UDP:flavonoid glycosyltransferase YjiC (YdhE family)
MTHFARPAALAAALDPAEWDVFFWTPKRFHALLGDTADSLGDLRTLDPDAFLHSLANGAVLYTSDVLREYVRDDLAIFKQVQPDLVIGDYRLSLCISAPLSGLPFASIFNAHWSPFYRQPAVVPELPVTRWISPRILNPLYAGLRPAFFALHAKPVNDARRAFGLSRLSHDLRRIYTAGDIVLYPDVPEFVRLTGAPGHHHFIGTCAWPMHVTKPPWWNDVMASSQPKVFVSLGSSGPIKALPAVLEALSRLPVRVILSTSGRPVGLMPSNVSLADLLPYEETASRSAVVVSHGGTGGVYPALTAGTPMLAIPSNIDMHLSASLLEAAGAGIKVRVERASPDRLQEGLERLLAEPRFKQAAAKWSGIMGRYDTKTIFPDLLRRWFARSKEQNGI